MFRKSSQENILLRTLDDGHRNVHYVVLPEASVRLSVSG
jgi:hypothetical protein